MKGFLRKKGDAAGPDASCAAAGIVRGPAGAARNTPPDALPDGGFSLLRPAGKRPAAHPLSRRVVADLGFEKLISALTVDKSREGPLRDLMLEPCPDPAVIEYRLDVLDDLAGSEALSRCFEELVPVIASLSYFIARPEHDDWSPFQETVWRLRELEHYAECVKKLDAAFSGERGSAAGEPVLRSEALKRLRALTGQLTGDPAFMRLLGRLPELLETIDRLRSVTIGVNLNGALQPYEAVLLSVGSKPFSGSGLYDRLIGRDGTHGIAPLHSAESGGFASNPLMVPLFRDLAMVMNRTVQPLAAALKEFVNLNGRMFVRLRDEILFYVGAVRLVRFLTSRGMPMVRPRIEPQAAGRFSVRGLYNIELALRFGRETDSAALRSRVVGSDLTQDRAGRIVILTGPNRGGKTTFLQAVGLAQVLAQIGLYVPAREAAISPCDAVFTHYPALEVPERGTGRFGEEAERLKAIFSSATGTSLILLNETLSSTSMGESLYLAQDLLGLFRMMGCRVIYTTHLHQLAAEIDRINAEIPGDEALVSMVAGIERSGEGPHGIRPTFRIEPGPPSGYSYALELASRYGIGRDQLLAELSSRGAVVSGRT